MSLIKAIRQQLGLSVTPGNNFTLDASADNGTMRLARGNAGATTQDIMIVDAAGKAVFPQNKTPAFSALSVGAAIGAGETLITYTEEIDTDNCFTPGTGRFMPNVAGFYIFTATVSNNVNGAATCSGRIRKNGTDPISLATQTIPAGVGGAYMPVSALIYMNGTTDYVDTAITNGIAGFSVRANQLFSGCLVRAA